MAISFGKQKFQTVEEFPLEGKSVFLRVDLNVPLDGKEITDDTRIRAALPTLKYLLEKGAKVTMASHLGRPKGKPNEKYSLLPVAEKLAELLSRDVTLPDDCIGDGVRRILSQQKPEQVVLLENLRFHAEEEGNAPKFAKELRGSFDFYVTDAFGALHRAHASTEALPRLFAPGERGIGFLVMKELRFLSPLLENPQRPFAVIMGGAKVSDKVKVVETLIRKVDRIFLGGAMVFTFLKAQGHKVGLSLVEEGMVDRAKKMLEDAKGRGVRVYLPKDFVLGVSVENPGEPKTIDGLEIPDGFMGLDVGPQTVRLFADALKDTKTVFWNGPLGLFEKPPFDQGTLGIAKALATLNMIRVIGGGDSAAAVEAAGVADKMSHISTGGGASLEYLEGQPLPGLVAVAV
ncbi:MAG: phosphoglycerate kinase [Pseudomonadota bacterium]